jgi:geranylgeranyl pyrophosphate synthase/predicted secreted hydrolase
VAYDETGFLGQWRADWPERGAEVVLARDGVPHLGCGTEWWNFHCRLTTATGEKYDLFCVFARYEATAPDGERLVTHALCWAHMDPEDGFCVSESWLDSVDLLRRATEADQAMDRFVRAAFVEALADGAPIGPDHLLPRPVRTGTDGLNLDYGGVGALRAVSDGSYEVVITGENARFRLTFTSVKPATVQGADGVLPGRRADGADAVFAYAIPRLTVRGTLEPLGAEPVEVSGTGWHDHAFGGDWFRLDPHRALDRGWDWVRVQLDNGWELSTATVRYSGAGEHVVSAACAPNGQRTACSITVSATEPWTSLATLHTYPTRFDIVAPDLDLSLTIRADTPYPELDSLVPGVHALSPWTVTEGVMRGEPVRGSAVLDLLPFTRIDDLENYPRRLNPMVQAEIDAVFPRRPSLDSAARMMGIDRSELEGVSPEVLHRALIEPIRYLTDSGGKQWRAFTGYIMARMCGARGQDVLPGLALFELLQSAMLAIDDVEDGSPLRRGRPSAHEVFGVAETINAAYALVFTLEQLAAEQERKRTEPLPQRATDPRARLGGYQTYMKAMRTAHLGQGLDITGHAEAMDTAVETGDPSQLLQAIRVTHRFKTANVFRYIAELAVGTVEDDPDAPALGEYSEAIGVAFQITDDVLDLSGVSGRDATGQHRLLKRECEDLHAGKVTMPLALAVRLLPRERMRELWHSIRGGQADPDTVREVAKTLEECGAVEACYAEAKELVDRTWRQLDAIPVTYHKVLCRAAGLYFAGRTGDDSVG